MTMDLIADASAVVAELLRARGRALLSHPDVRWFTTVEIQGEVRHEVVRRIRILADRQQLPAEQAITLTQRALLLFEETVSVIPQGVYTPFADLARARIGDPQDWSAIALALASGASIWTEDRDFFGVGLPVWNTRVLLKHLTIA
jgi:predicted nucleic acid-binding protein